MELRKAVLVLVDISGYTQFVVLHRISILHAEQIITELIEAVAAEARHPLRLNKLEGDAALFVAPFDGDAAPAVGDVLDQVVRFFEAFRERKLALFEESVGGCICSACQNLETLELKAVLHVDEVVLKRVGSFDEVAGKGVILIHRLLKNSVQQDEYLLITKDADVGGRDPFPFKAPHRELVDDLGPVECVVYAPEPLPIERPDVRPLTRPGGLRAALRLSWRRLFERRRYRKRPFRSLPA